MVSSTPTTSFCSWPRPVLSSAYCTGSSAAAVASRTKLARASGGTGSAGAFSAHQAPSASIAPSSAGATKTSEMSTPSVSPRNRNASGAVTTLKNVSASASASQPSRPSRKPPLGRRQPKPSSATATAPLSKANQ